ncbi:MAG: CDP-alcohol phosphatidyltransferase family protein [Myxococcales bacterium]|nr:CDP-alcohol phosphatidyltransferase family protein [Myxococcales bacterium]
MDLLLIVAPAIVLLGLHVAGFSTYSALYALGKAPAVAGLEGKRFSLGRHFMVYWHWSLSPFELFLVRKRVSPNAISFVAMLVSFTSGLAIATGHLATGAWLYALSGTLDIVDGRLARATERSSAAGGFLDSVADRWSEAAVFIGFAWLLKDTNWFLAVIVALAGSMMVSYVRAAGEVRGTLLDGGLMKRPERIVAVAAGTFACAILASIPSTIHLVPTVMGSVLAVVGVGSMLTAVGRWIRGYKNLHAMEMAACAKAQIPRKTPAEAVGVVLGADSRSNIDVPVQAQAAAPLGVVAAGAESSASATTHL